MKNFISWNLEREHGDLGLGSSARKPPLSPLGKSLISKTASKSVQIHANEVYDSAGEHIGLAKARLDLIHNMNSLDGIETRRDQLPANIVTIFDFGLKRIEGQPPKQSDIALKAIAAASVHIKGVDIPELRARLQNYGAAETRSGEDILEATRGFLLGTIRDDPQKLAAYHQSFFYYIAERYHQGIHQSWDYHHGSYASLNKSHEWEAEHQTPSKASKEAKKERCLFCSTLHDDIEKLAPKLQSAEYAAAWPVCRWNIRSLAKIRESLETIVVTFRYVPPTSEIDDMGGANAELPTRTFFLFPEEDVQPLPTAQELGVSTNPALNGGHRIRSWVETCDLTHTDCMKRRRATPRSKSGPPEAPVRLVETASSSVQGPYCSLSHCWGEPNFVQLHVENKEKFKKEGVGWHLFPTNFQHAIEIVRALDIGYIWIDSLCIIQNSADDWNYEGSRMHLVYRNSHCNIAIADSPDSSYGAYRTRDPEDVVPVKYQPVTDSPFFGRKSWVAVAKNLWESELLHSDLYSRAWVFQERMLSPRILHFAKSQVFWDCPSLSACETLPAGLPQPMDSAAGPDRHWRGRLQEPEGSQELLAGAIDQSLGSFWKTAVGKYSSCNLTKGKDKLKAFWGIAKLVRDALGTEYGEGLWEENLEDQLAWRVEDCKLTERPNESLDVKFAREIPSWSWASMDGTVVVPDRLSDQLHHKVKDHDGRPLSFDLKGVKRLVRTASKRPGNEAPPMPARGISDSGPELQRRKEQRAKEQLGMSDKEEIHRSSSPEKINRDAEPEYYSKSIRIQGHVGRGRLQWDDTRKKWVLQIDGISDVEVEAFPDIVPVLGDSVAELPYFAVLAAKQVTKPSSFKPNMGPKPLERRGTLPKIDELEDPRDNEDFDYAGHGILMKYTGDDRFRRTGAFRFRNANDGFYKRLQETENWEEISPEMYHPTRGRKFWLD
ncbi:tol protein [Cucurbitaria berberidis CBS 394.84]|uniref:Tol protein n=1 Tax=Cucurbitaria berberidis CBS 394.84 TaxID=1168544 RepID=A0A9P4G7K0_9PLEO|nr:tol protein [Cucurbitaria berberidis CBS 394.84]KAF1840464.1 tol protein [Cucurbitaria berberidis CBS 394.84]